MPGLTLIGKIPMRGIVGRFDHLMIDPATMRAYVAALENQTLEVVDLKARRRVHTIESMREPQGILIVPGKNQVLVLSRGDGTCRSFDTHTFQQDRWVDVGHNADNLRLDPVRRIVYTAAGGEPGAGVVSAIDLKMLLPVSKGGQLTPPRSRADLFPPKQGDSKADIEVEGHPESFQLDPAHHRLFINNPEGHYVEVIDTKNDKLKSVAKWPVPYERNFPMTYDAQTQRLYVASRNPPRLLTYDTQKGKLLSQLFCVGDADDMFVNHATHRLYVIGGGGAVDIFETAPTQDTVKFVERILTSPRARTAAYLPAQHLMVVAAPNYKGHPAQLLMYRVN